MSDKSVTLRYFAQSADAALLLTEPALESMLRYQQLRLKDKEAGGQLFARFQGPEAIIVEATRPKKLDRRTRCSFRPNQWLQRCEIKNRYARALHFVGDWHTHPEATPSPSHDDIAGMQECFRRSKHDLNAFVLVILGTDPPPEGLYVVLVHGDGFQRLRCQLGGLVTPNCL